MNSKTTPNQPLKIEMERKTEIERENKIKSKIEKETESENGSSVISNSIYNSSLDNTIDYSNNTITKAQSEPSVNANIKDDRDFLSSIMLDDDDDMASNGVGGSMDINMYWEQRLKMGLGV